MPTPQSLLPDAIRFFFDQALPEATNRPFAELSSPRVHLGSYLRYEGGPVSAFGQSLTPTYCLKVSPALPMKDGRPDAPAAAPPTDGPVVHILWLRHVADAGVDGEDEIARVMADLDSLGGAMGSDGAEAPAEGSVEGSPGEGAGGGTSAGGAGGGATGGGASPQGGPAVAAAALRASDWARAVVASRSEVAHNLDSIAAVPGAFKDLVADVAGLQQVLRHFFTYTDEGVYYQRWAGAGRDASNTEHLTPEYKQANLREVLLDRDRLYCYAVVPEGLLSGAGDLGGGVFREVVFRLDETLIPERPFTLATVHTARWRRTAGPHEDFVFFYADDGVGVPLPREARMKLSARLVEFLGQLAVAADREAFFAGASFVTRDEDGPYLVHLAARVKEGAQLPDFVLTDTDEPNRIIQVPPERIVELALVPDVEKLSLINEGRLSLADARTMLKKADLDAKIAAAKRGGKGVVVGIIDSGIDGSHPAFTGRLHAFWDQGNPTLVTGKSPRGNNPTDDAYKLFNFGVELTGSDTSKAQDTNGHGTHVAGIAAGAEVKDSAGAVLMSSGMAPQATIVAVRAIAATGPGLPVRADWVLGAKYIFQKAAELGLPCVINMSFGHHHNAHDGSDDESLALYRAFADKGTYQAGKVVVAAAGNERSFSMHSRRTLPAGGGYRRVATVNLPAGLRSESVLVWIRNPTDTCPVAFPLDLYTYRISTPQGTDATKAVRIGSQAPQASPAGLFVSQRTGVLVFSQMSNVINGDHEYRVLFGSTHPTQPMNANRWAIMMRNGSSDPLDVHVWLPDGDRTGSSLIGATHAEDTAYLVGSPAASAAALSVASVNSRVTWAAKSGNQSLVSPPPVGDLSDFSSPGPLRASSISPAKFYKATHEINGVDCSAPGCMIQSALSAQVASPDPNFQINARAQVMAGTSMASPMVTGLVANILAEEPSLTLPQALERLKKASRIPASSRFQPAAGSGANPLQRDWGYGLVDAGKLKP